MRVIYVIPIYTCNLIFKKYFHLKYLMVYTGIKVKKNIKMIVKFSQAYIFLTL